MATVMKREWTHKGVTKTAWIVRYLDDTGSKRQKTFEKKKEADAYRDQVKREISDGSHVAKAATITVKELCEHYLRHCEDRVHDGRIGRSRLHCLTVASNRSVIPGIGPRLVSELTALDIEEWYRWMIRTGKLLPPTAKERVQIFKLMLDHGIRYRWVKGNVAVEMLKELRGVRKGKIRTFTIEEVRTLLSSLSKRRHGQRDRPHALNVCFVNLAAFCGLRYGEVSGLTVENLDFTRRLIRVRHSLTKFDELKGPKTASGVRDVPMPVHVAAMLRAWLDRFYLPNERGLVFTTRNGKRVEGSSWVSQDWHAVLRHAGLYSDARRLRVHALRHFCASWMLETGWSVTETAQHLGHASFDMTLSTYSHVVVGGNRRHDMIERSIELALPPVSSRPVATVLDATETQQP
jgi:integrase